MELPTYTKQWHRDVYPDIDASRPELAVKGKRIVVSGAAGGIGAAAVEAFAKASAAEVVMLGRTQKTLEAAKSAISNKYPETNLISIVADVGNQKSVADAFANIESRGSIDILVSNAGYQAMGDVATSDPEEYSKAYETNVLGSIFFVQAALKNFNKDGIIINTSSAAGHVPFVPGYAPYAASKIAGARVFEYLQHENPHLRVYNLQPGIIESTGMATKATAYSGISFPQQDTVELPGNFMVWLCSPEAEFLKGRFIWANWDVKELMEKKEALKEDPMMLTMGLVGWP